MEKQIIPDIIIASEEDALPITLITKRTVIKIKAKANGVNIGIFLIEHDPLWTRVDIYQSDKKKRFLGQYNGVTDFSEIIAKTILRKYLIQEF